MASSPDIKVFSYLDYRQYLKDLFHAEKDRKKFFSYSYFAKISGFGSTGYLKMIMDGQRNISLKSVIKISQAFKLQKKEAAYFESLVLFNQAKTDEERERYLDQLISLNPKRAKLTGITREKYEYFTKKHYAIIRELIAIPDFQEDPEWISKHLSPPITPKEAEKTIETLLNLKMIKRDKNGKLVQSEATVTPPPEVQALEVFQYHGQMLSLAKEALLKTQEQLRDISALTIPITLETLPEIKKRIQELREGIIDLVNKGDQNFDEVYQINIQCFPATKLTVKQKNKV